MGNRARRTDIILSAQQIRAARSLLGWSRRELAIVSAVSSGAIKAIEHGASDPRLSTLRKLAQTFKAHDIEFLSEGDWTGVVISSPNVSDQPKGSDPANRDEMSVATSGKRMLRRGDLSIRDPNPIDTAPQNKPKGYRWLEPLRAAKRA